MAELLRNLGHATVPVLAVLSAVGAMYSVWVAIRAWQDAVKLDQEERGAAERLLAPLAAQLAPQTEIQVREARRRLVRAGLRADGDMRRFNTARAVVVAVAAALAVFVQFGEGSLLQLLFLAVLLLYAAVKLPDIWLDRRIAERQARIARALPSVVDLMVLCLDVGLSVEAAFDRVTTEMRTMEPLMAEEARLTVGEMAAGLTFPQAFMRLSERIDLAELTTMARLINQAASLGASITQALREYSEGSFTKRMLTLEEHAGKVTAWLVMPLTVCMLPACLLALIGPAALMIVRSVGN